MQEMLETERLILRPWTEADAPALYELARDPQVGPMAGWPVHKSGEDSREVIRTVFSAPGTWAVTDRSTGALLGSAGLTIGKKGTHDMGPKGAEIGYWMGVPHWGRGYMSEAVEALVCHAFGDLGLDTLWCGYFDENVRSRRVMEKCGFSYHHTEADKLCELLDEVRTEHYTTLTREAWKKRHLTMDVKLVRPGAAPFYATPGAAAMDLRACLDAPLELKPGGRAMVPVGVAIALPSADYVGLLFTRSSLSVKHGIALSNGVGVIDSDYRGELVAALVNLSGTPYTIQPGDRVAQLAVLPVSHPQIRFVDELGATDRGAGGFGSTGR